MKNFTLIALGSMMSAVAFGCGGEGGGDDGETGGTGGSAYPSTGGAGLGGNATGGGATGGTSSGGSSGVGTSGGAASGGSPTSDLECPATAPEGGEACSGTGACQFDSGACVCSGEQWTCLGDTDPASCPLWQPDSGDACGGTASGDVCTYATGVCLCAAGGTFECIGTGGGF